MSPKEKKRLAKLSQRQLNAKLRFEKRLASGVRKFLKKQNRVVERYSAEFGFRFDAGTNQHEIELLLNSHYSRVSKYFSKQVIDDFNSSLAAAGIEKIDRNDPIILAAMASFISSSAADGAARITARSNRDIAASFRGGVEPSKARSRLDKTILSRSQQLSVEHTQRAAEGGKDIVSTASQRAAQGAAFVAVVTMLREKTWMTRMDIDVRSAHAAALFQTVLATLPFSVGGEQLMFPGDMSLGASIGNVANCRCNAIYSMRTE